MLKAARIMAATAIAWAVILAFEVAAIAAEPVPSCGGFGGGGAPAGGDSGGMMGIMFPLLVFVVIFYFFIMRPQKKRQKQQDDLIVSVAKGDQIVTIGGFHGKVQEVRDDCFIIELGNPPKDIRAKISKTAVAHKIVPAQSPAQAENK